MKFIHEKSACCSARIIHFGGRRRQCIACQKTWRVHKAKRGRPKTRKQFNRLKKIFAEGFKVKQTASMKLKRSALYKRFAKDLEALIKSKRELDIPDEKLILIIDAQWKYFNGKLWTMYFLALKPVSSKTVIILDPIIRRGKESARVWNRIIGHVPLRVRKRIIALVSDGLRGVETIAEERRWLMQRCYFHLLSQLQKRRGKRASTPGRKVREKIFRLTKYALKESSNKRLNKLCKKLAELAKHEDCPKAMRMTVRDFLRRIDEFRCYIDHPQFNLPCTTNIMESINSLVVRRCGTVNTPKAWFRWALACIRFKSVFTCK